VSVLEVVVVLDTVDVVVVETVVVVDSHAVNPSGHICVPSSKAAHIPIPGKMHGPNELRAQPGHRTPSSPATPIIAARARVAMGAKYRKQAIPRLFERGAGAVGLSIIV